MKLLILTQKIDINDDILGFFHNWVLEFSKLHEKVTVICLEKGNHELPENVKVLSLGKEQLKNPPLFRVVKGKNKILYCFRFYKYIWRERKNYDAVFVHMNHEYIVLGGILWKLWQKRVILWYNHKYGKLMSRIAVYFVSSICYTSSFSFFARHSKAKIMPTGIDTDLFKPKKETIKLKNSLLFLGRIAPVKKIEILIKACAILKNKGCDLILNIVGEPLDVNKVYCKKLQTLVLEKGINEKVNFLEKVPNYLAPEIFNKNEYFINLTNSGSMDKTIFEAMACGCAVLACNISLKAILPMEMRNLLLFQEDDEYDLADKILNLISLEENKKTEIQKKLRSIVVQKHDIKITIKAIGKLFAS